MTNNHTHLKSCSLNELFQWTSFQMQHALTHVLQHIIFNINWQQCFSPSHRHKGKQLTHQNFVFQALLTAKSMTALLRSKVLTANSSSLCSPSSSENHFHDLLSNNKTTKHAQLMLTGLRDFSWRDNGHEGQIPDLQHGFHIQIFTNRCLFKFISLGKN